MYSSVAIYRVTQRSSTTFTHTRRFRSLIKFITRVNTRNIHVCYLLLHKKHCYFFKIMPLRCCPTRLVHSRTRVTTFPITRDSVAVCMVLILSTILCSSVSKSGGRVSKILCLRYPHKKKSHAVRSGDLAGQGKSRKREIIRCWKIGRNVLNDSRVVCAVAPSCWK
jgi:hypothetical protein